MANEQDTMDEWAAALAEAEGSSGASAVELDELKEEPAQLTVDEKRKLDTILDIPVTISMEVGRAKISIRNLLQLNQGSVVELERLAGEPLDETTSDWISRAIGKPIVDNYWQTETGACMISPMPGTSRSIAATVSRPSVQPSVWRM